MHVPFHLNRRTSSGPAAGLLLLSHDPVELLAVCVGLGYDPLPDLFTTADGFLLLLDVPTEKTFPRTLRLRREGEYLLVPVDGDLAPQLHADEANALMRQRGLVFLAGGRCLCFDPKCPLQMQQLLSVGETRHNAWEPLPEPRALTDTIRSIRLEVPGDDADNAVAGGGEGVGSEDIRPDGAGVGKTAANRVRMTLGQMLGAIGRALGIDRLKKAGERMVEKAIEAVPRLSERLYGDQEAALRNLLKKFRDGKTEDALSASHSQGRGDVAPRPGGGRIATADSQSSLYVGQYSRRRRKWPGQLLAWPLRRDRRAVA